MYQLSLLTNPLFQYHAMYTPTITRKTTIIHQSFVSMYPNGNTELQIRKWWVPLRSALCLFSFCLDLFQYLSIISTRCTPDNTLKEIFHFFKTIIIYPSRAPLSNYAKLKRVSEVYYVLYNDSAGKKTLSK